MHSNSSMAGLSRCQMVNDLILQTFDREQWCPVYEARFKCPIWVAFGRFWASKRMTIRTLVSTTQTTKPD